MFPAHVHGCTLFRNTGEGAGAVCGVRLHRFREDRGDPQQVPGPATEGGQSAQDTTTQGTEKTNHRI